MPRRPGPPRLLIVGLNYAPEPVGIGPYTTGLAEGLVARGWQVEAVVGEPYYPYWQRFSGQSSGWRANVENGVRIMRCPHYIPARPSGAKRLMHHASFAISSTLPAVVAGLRRRPDYVLAVAPSLLSVPVALFAARLSGAKSWVHVQDFEVEAAVATGLIKPGSIVARLARGIETRLLRSADRVTTISPQMLTRLLDKGVDPAQAGEMRNWANHQSMIEQGDGTDLRRAWGLDDKTVALYSGNIGNKQGLELVVDAARSLADRSDIAFVICGNGPTRGRIEEAARSLPNLQVHDLQPVERVGDMLKMADLHLLPQLAGAADLVLPSKLTNMLASGRPVIATADPGTGLAHEVAGCGLVVPPGDGGAVADAVVALADDVDLRVQLGAAAQERARTRWSRDAIIDTTDASLRKDISA